MKQPRYNVGGTIPHYKFKIACIVTANLRQHGNVGHLKLIEQGVRSAITSHLCREVKIIGVSGEHGINYICVSEKVSLAAFVRNLTTLWKSRKLLWGGLVG